MAVVSSWFESFPSVG